jgi:hypothetical protein
MTIERKRTGWWVASDIVDNHLITAKGDTKAGAKQALAQLIRERRKK